MECNTYKNCQCNRSSNNPPDPSVSDDPAALRERLNIFMYLYDDLLFDINNQCLNTIY